MARWTIEQVLAAAPDESSRKSAKGLTSPKRWSELGSTDALLWGKCQGSGRDPYQVTVDLNGPAFRCTCPSRKFPCKHGVALMLMWAANDGSVSDVPEVSAFADEWAKDRTDKEQVKSERAAKKAEKIASGEDVSDPAAREKREAKRDTNITAGLVEFDRWMCDLIRAGLSTARSKPYSFWDAAAARLVDAQAPSLADRVRNLGSMVLTRSDWNDCLLRELSRLSTIVAAWQRRAHLDESTNAELRRLVGWSRSTDEVRALGSIADTWTFVGRFQSFTDRMSSQRTWLWGTNSQQWAVILDFALGSAHFEVSHTTSSIVEGSVALYPGLIPRRALVMDVAPTSTATSFPYTMSVATALSRITTTLATNPWTEYIPVVLSQVELIGSARSWSFRDEHGDTVPVVSTFEPWTLLAQRGPGRFDVFGEWSDDGFLPATVCTAAGLVTV